MRIPDADCDPLNTPRLSAALLRFRGGSNLGDAKSTESSGTTAPPNESAVLTAAAPIRLQLNRKSLLIEAETSQPSPTVTVSFWKMEESILLSEPYRDCV